MVTNGIQKAYIPLILWSIFSGGMCSADIPITMNGLHLGSNGAWYWAGTTLVVPGKIENVSGEDKEEVRVYITGNAASPWGLLQYAGNGTWKKTSAYTGDTLYIRMGGSRSLLPTDQEINVAPGEPANAQYPYVKIGDLDAGESKDLEIRLTFQIAGGGRGGTWNAPYTQWITLATGGEHEPLRNQPPTAYDQAIITQVETPVQITLSATDPEGDTLGFFWSSPSHGTLLGSGNVPPGTSTCPVVYVPDPDYTGEDSFSFVAYERRMNVAVPYTVSAYSAPSVPIGGRNTNISEPATVMITVAETCQGSISGIVKDAITQAGLGDVTIRVLDGDTVVATGYTDPSGNYSLPVFVGEDYVVRFEKTGYLPANYQSVSVQEEVTTYLEAVLQIDSGHSGLGVVSGRILNALDGSGVDMLTLNLREGINATDGPIIATTTTGTAGMYAFTDQPAGHYTAEVSGTGYITTYFTVVSIGGQATSGQDATITPLLSGNGIRIILTWGDSPTDLDSHLTGPLPDGFVFHMFYPYAELNSGSPWPQYVQLDLDDVSSYGPETTTILQQLDGVYKFTVHDYSNRYSSSSVVLSDSDAMVQVYSGSQLVATFHVPSGQGGTAWTVFEMNGQTITPVNVLYYASSPSGIQAQQSGADDLLSNLPEKESDR